MRYTYQGSFLKYLVKAFQVLPKVLGVEALLPLLPLLLVGVFDQVPETLLGRYYQRLLVKVGGEIGKKEARK